MGAINQWICRDSSNNGVYLKRESDQANQKPDAKMILFKKALSNTPKLFVYNIKNILKIIYQNLYYLLLNIYYLIYYYLYYIL